MRPTADRFKWLWRGVAATLLLMLLAVMVVPIAAAQGNADDSLPPCCRAAGVHGCSMRMHRAMQHDSHSHELAAFTERCPCPPFAPSVVASHDAPATVSFWTGTAPAVPSSRRIVSVAVPRDIFVSEGDPRGPPSSLLA